MLTIHHCAVSVAPGDKMGMGSYRAVAINPAVEQRIETTIKALKVGTLF